MTEEAKKEEAVTESNKIQIEKSEYESMKQGMENLKNEVSSLLEHRNKVLSEKKQKAKEVEEMSKKSGDFEQLYKSSDDKRKELEEKLNNLYNDRAQERIKSEAFKLASSQGLAEGDNVELLSTFIERRLKYTDEGIKVVDANGNLTVSTLDDLKKEFISNPKYASLITSTKATGGGATGSRSSASKITLKRSEFNQLNPIEQSNFLLKEGGKLEN